MTSKRLFLALTPLALLAACGKEAPAEGDSRSASGTVLEGTISDAMLPVDTVQSQPPLAEPEAAEKLAAEAREAVGDAEAGEDAEATAAGEAEPAPAVDPSPEAED